jgi:hypothetical protein
MSDLRPVKILASFGAMCFIVAAVGVIAGPPIDKYFSWAPEDVVWDDVVLEGRFGNRWYRYAKGLLGMGLLLILAASFLWYRGRRDEKSSSLLEDE